MAFSAKNLRPLGDVVTTGVIPTVWAYYNSGSDTVTTAGFIPAGYNVKAKDQVLVIAANGQSNAWYYASVSSGVITLTAES